MTVVVGCYCRLHSNSGHNAEGQSFTVCLFVLICVEPYFRACRHVGVKAVKVEQRLLQQLVILEPEAASST